jgi:hypothetical protein
VIWVAWRQQRWQVLVVLGIVVSLAAVMTFVRFDALSLADDWALLGDRYDQYLGYARLVLVALPVLLGAIAGAPLFAREIEQGTHVFGLTQSIGRTRWWATKLAVAGLPLVLGMTFLGLMSTWSENALSPISYGSRMATPLFEVQGLVLGAYAALAFTLSAAVGLLVGNTVTAMVVAIVGYVPVLGVAANALRPSYAEPLAGPASSAPEGAWEVHREHRDAAGNPADFSALTCPESQSTQACLAERGVVPHVRFHPDDRFWSFQVLEAGLFIALSAAVLAVSAWVLHKRLRLR